MLKVGILLKITPKQRSAYTFKVVAVCQLNEIAQHFA